MHLKFLSPVLALALYPALAPAQNVGIGTTAPQAKLHLKHNGEALRLEGDGSYLSFYDNLGQYLGYLWARNNDRLDLGTASGSGKPVTISPGTNPVAIFTTAGRVGIGTTSPFTTLDVNGGIRLRYPGTFEFGNTLNNGGLSFQAGLFTNNEFGIYSNQSATWALRLTSQGALSLTDAVTATRFQYPQPAFRFYSVGGEEARTQDGFQAAFEPTDAYWAPDFTRTSFRGFQLPVHLEDGVEVTGMSVTFYDGSATENLQVLFVSRATAGIDQLLLRANLITSGSPGYGSVTVPATNGGVVINNRDYTYYIDISGPSGWTNRQLRVKSIVLTYRVSGPI